jgi:hypothetical protein
MMIRSYLRRVSLQLTESHSHRGLLFIHIIKQHSTRFLSLTVILDDISSITLQERVTMTIDVFVYFKTQAG